MSTETTTHAGKRFHEEVERVGNVSKVADTAGVARGTIYKWCESGAIPATALESLARIGIDGAYVVTGRRGALSGTDRSRDFGAGHVSSEDIAFGMPPSLRQEIREREERWGASLSMEEAVQLVRSGTYVWVPYYDIPLAAGAGAAVFDRPPRQWNFYNRRYIEQRGLTPADLAEFPIVGHSMPGVLNHGDTALLDRSRTVPSAEVAVYAARVGDDLIVKFMKAEADGSITVSSSDAENYPTFVIPATALESGAAAVLGRVVRRGADR